jgi:hypothetical protein
MTRSGCCASRKKPEPERDPCSLPMLEERDKERCIIW